MDLEELELPEVYNLIKEDKITIIEFEFWVSLQEDKAYETGYEAAYE